MEVSLATLETRQKRLIKRATYSERIFQSRLRAAKIEFEFQEVIPPYIADFLIWRRMLIIELDGGVHDDPEAKRYDLRRTRYLENLGFRVIRIANENAAAWDLGQIEKVPESAAYFHASETAKRFIETPRKSKKQKAERWRKRRGPRQAECGACGRIVIVRKNSHLVSHKHKGKGAGNKKGQWCIGGWSQTRKARALSER